MIDVRDLAGTTTLFVIAVWTGDPLSISVDSAWFLITAFEPYLGVLKGFLCDLDPFRQLAQSLLLASQARRDRAWACAVELF